MAVSYSQCVQSLKVSLTGSDRCRDNDMKRNCLVFASSTESNSNPVLQSKVTFVALTIMHSHFLFVDQLLYFSVLWNRKLKFEYIWWYLLPFIWWLFELYRIVFRLEPFKISLASLDGLGESVNVLRMHAYWQKFKLRIVDAHRSHRCSNGWA